MIFTLGIFLRRLIRPWFAFLREPGLLLQWFISASALILVVLALRAALKGCVSCRLRYALWAVVLVRLLLPLQIPVSLSWSTAELTPDLPQSWEEAAVPVFPAAPQEMEEAPHEYQELEPGQVSPSEGSDFYVRRSEDGQTLTAYADIFTPDEVVQSIWWVGVLVTGLLLLAANLRFALRLEKRRRLLAVEGYPIPVYRAEGLSSPCLFGLLWPAVYLTPEAAADETVKTHVLAHELTHYAHKDHIWALLRCLCLALHWYNPLVWLAVILSKGDGELACDEGAVARLGEEQRMSYGRTLVDMVAQRPARPADLLSCSTTMTAGKHAMKERISQLVRRPHTVKTALFAAVAVAALAVVVTFAGKAARDPYQTYLERVEEAGSIGVGVPVYSSAAYPDPITDADLLEEAKAILGAAQSTTKTAEDLEDAVRFTASTVVLTGGSSQGAGQSRYLLYQQDGTLYVVISTGSDLSDYTPVAELDSSASLSLESLARKQQQRNLSPLYGLEFTSGETEPQSVARDFLEAVKVYLLDLPEEESGSASSVREDLSTLSIIPYTGDGIRVTLSLVLSPNHPEHACWQTGGGMTQWEDTGPMAEPLWTYLATCHLIRQPGNQWMCDGVESGSAQNLTEEELAWFGEEFFNGGYLNVRNLFLNSRYDRPENVDLFELFYNGSGLSVGSVMTAAETQAVVDAGYGGVQPDCACVKITPGEMDAVLLENAGLTLEQTNRVGLDQFIYLPEYDAYYHFHGDTNYYVNVSFFGGVRENGVVSLYYNDYYGPGGICVVTLRQEGEQYYFQANQAEADVMPERERWTSTLEFMRELQAGDIFDYGTMNSGYFSGAEDLDPEVLTDLIHQAAEHPLTRAYDTMRHDIWSLEIYVTSVDGQPYMGAGDNELRLSAGTEENVVCFTYPYSSDRDARNVFAESPELYQLIRSLFVQPKGGVVQADLDAVRSTVDQALADELEVQNQALAQFSGAQYTGIQLTEFRKVTSYPDLVQEGTVSLYIFDYGLTIDDLGRALWAGGNYADGSGLFYPEHKMHLLAVERDGQAEQYTVFGWEFLLELGQDAWDVVVDEQYILDVVTGILRQMMDPVVPASAAGPQQAAEAYGEGLAQYYRSLGSGHPGAVTDAQLAGAELYEQTEDALCANITLAVDPVEPNSIYWMAGAGIDYDAASGHWLYALQYRLERQTDGTWHCTDRGTGGVSLG